MSLSKRNLLSNTHHTDVPSGGVAYHRAFGLSGCLWWAISHFGERKDLCVTSAQGGYHYELTLIFGSQQSEIDRVRVKGCIHPCRETECH